jgi:hypothetical protein
VTDPNLRASDADRHRVVAALEEHTAAGRLSLDEFGERVTRALSAVTHGELAAVTRDLPAEPAPGPVEASVDRMHPPQLLVAFLLAAIALVILAVVLGLVAR